MHIPLRVKLGIAVAAFVAAGRHILRTGYFPREWPLKLSLAMGVLKAALRYLPEFTVEEVFP
jgi:hypothetical protein